MTAFSLMLFLVFAALALYAFQKKHEAEGQRRIAEEQKELALLREKAAVVLNLLPVTPVDGLVLAIGATGQSLSKFDQMRGSVDSSLNRAIQTAREQNLFHGHADGVMSVAFSPEGKTIISASADDTVRLWDTKGNRVGQPFVGHSDDVTSVAFSPDGKTIISASTDDTLRRWDLAGNPLGAPFVGHTDDVTSVAFSPDGKTVVSGSADKSLRLWDLAGNPVGMPFVGHTGEVTSVAFRPDGQTIVSGSADRTVRLWRANWRGWLKVGCDRLRRHPVFEHPDTDIQQAALQTCQDHVWNNESADPCK